MQYKTLFMSILLGILIIAFSFKVIAQKTADTFMFPVENYKVDGYYFGQSLGGNIVHVGEDCGLPPGKEIRAVANGYIKLSKTHDTYYGQVIAIEHTLPSGEKVCSIYGHLSRKDGYPMRSIGPVDKGNVIGYIGWDSENGEGGPHLHLGIRKGAYVYLIEGKAANTNNFYKPSEFINQHSGPSQPHQPGYFSDGPHSGISEKFVGCYNYHGAASTIGDPFDNGSGPYVHYWPDNGNPNSPGNQEALLLQDFKNQNGHWWQLVYNPHIDYVHPVHGGILWFWNQNWGWRDYGPPASIELIGTYSRGKYGNPGDRMVIQKFSKRSEGFYKTIVWNERTGITKHHPVGFFQINGPQNAICYRYEDGDWIRWPNNQVVAPTGEWLIDAGSHTFMLKDNNDNKLSGFTVAISEGNKQTADPSPNVPILSISPTSLDFGYTTVQKTFNISNTGTGTLSWTVSKNKSWITTNYSNGSGNKTINVTIDRSNLSPGNHNGAVIVNSNGGDITINISVDKEVPPAAPAIIVNPNFLDFGDTIINKTFTISNNGGGTLTWSAYEDPNKSWITSINPSNGNLAAGQNISVTIRVDRSDLSEGNYSGNIMVVSNGGNDLVNIKISKTPPPSTGTNLLMNGDFSQGKDHWEIEVHTEHNCNADWQVNSGALKVNITSVGSNANNHPYRVQVKQIVTQLKKNTNYKLEFRCKGTIPWMAVTISKNEADWRDVGIFETENVSSSWETLEYTFKTRSDIISNNKLNFQIGTGTGEFWLDDVILKEVNEEPPSPDNNLIKNGDFSRGKDYWGIEVHTEHSCKADWTISSNGALRVNITDVGSNANNHPYRIQIKQIVTQIKSAKNYKLKFKYKGTIPWMAVTISKNESDWRDVGIFETTDFSSSWRIKEYTFKTKSDIISNNKLNFQIGTGVGEFWLDDVVLEESNDYKPLPETNLIMNGDFSQDKNNWGIEVHTEHNCKADWGVNNGALKVNITSVGSNANNHPYRVQVKQMVTQIKKNTNYKLRFRCKGTIPWIAVTISKNEADWRDVGIFETENVSSSWETKEYTFKTRSDIISNNKLNFQIGTGTGEFWLDDVVLEDAGGLYLSKDKTQLTIATKQENRINAVLFQNYPNPANPSTTISYSLVDPAHISLKIYNLKGQEMITLVNEYQSAGFYSIVWSGVNNRGILLSSGLYIYRLKINDLLLSKRITLVQ